MNRTNTILLMLMIALAAAGGWWWAQSDAPHKHQLEQARDASGNIIWTCAMHREVQQDAPGNCPICGMALIREKPPQSGQGEAEVLYWYDPMKPEVHFDAPGPSPFMDMQLVPKYASTGGRSVVSVDPAIVQSLGIRTAAVTRGSFWQRVDTVGTVAFNKHAQQALESRVEGWIQDLAVHVEGEPVERGQLLATLDAPELHAAQQEYILALRNGGGTLAEAAAARLRRLGQNSEQIRRLRNSGKASALSEVRSPIRGVVTRINVHAGARVGRDTPLMQIADLSQVWITVEVPEAQIGWISMGTAAEVRLQSRPGQLIETTVQYVYPEIDARTRTARLRLVLDNPDGQLMPGMYADIVLYGGARRDVLLAPSEAVIRTGERQLVMLDLGGGRYQPQPVRLGAERNGQVIIEQGLAEGDQLVVSGQFLLDSEASLQGAYRRLSEPQP